MEASDIEATVYEVQKQVGFLRDRLSIFCTERELDDADQVKSMSITELVRFANKIVRISRRMTPTT